MSSDSNLESASANDASYEIDMKLNAKKLYLIKELRFFLQRPKPILFDHLPKCGGSTISAFLKLNYPERLVFQTDGGNPGASVQHFISLPKNDRWKYRLVLGHDCNQIMKYTHSKLVRATVFREPVDRIVSHYFYVKKSQKHYLHKRIIEEGISLADYTCKGLSKELNNYYTCYFSGMSPDAVQNDPSMAVSAALKAVMENYNIIGFQDDIEGFLEEIKSTCRLPVALPMNRKNVTKDRKAVDALTEKEYTSISNSNALDIELYRLIREAVAGNLSA